MKKTVNVVMLVNTNTSGYALLFSTDLTLDALAIVKYYKARFQIEFVIRDAKQYTGLMDSQARNSKLDSAVFFKKFTCNFSQALFKHIFYSNSLPHQIGSYQSQLNAFLMGVNRIISTIVLPFFHKHF